MPFKSQSQRRLFYAKMSRGEFSPEMVNKWEAHTPKGKRLPDRLEKKSFWTGFYKKAGGDSAGLTGGSGFSGVGKGNVAGRLEFDGPFDGNIGALGSSTEDTRTDKALLDRERNPRDFSPFETGPNLVSESNPHIVY
jgi:hypothetical protein